jgi:tol-pal system protein YbgF
MTMKTHALLLTLILVAGMSASPAAADKETRQMMADIRMLQEQSQLIQNQIQSLMASLTDSMAGAVKTVSAKVDARTDEQAAAVRKGFTDQGLTITAINTDVRTLREKLDDATVRIGTLSQEVEALRKLVTQINVQRTTYDPVLGPPDGAPPIPADAAAVGESPTKHFNTAYSDYVQGQYDLAVSGFQTYIKNFPGEKADDAQYYICRSYLQNGKYQEAVDACDTAIRNYPTSDKLAEAYLRKGMAHQSLKQIDQARQAFERVVKGFPDSGEAILANQRLMSLKTP